MGTHAREEARRRMESDRPDGIAGLVLAAGGSTRWGAGSKLLARWGDATLVEAAVAAARSSGVDPLLVVTGDREDEVRRVLPAGVRVVHHPGWRDGRASSLAAGVRALAGEEGVAAVAVFLGDEPRVPPSAARRALEAWREGDADVVRPVYRDRPGHPVVFGRSRFPQLAELGGEEGVRRYLERGDVGVRPVHLDRPGPADVDTPADLRRLREAPGP